VVLVFILGYIIRYPDVISCEIKLRTDNPSVMLPLIQGSQIDKILVKNNAKVVIDDNLIVLKNNANYRDVLLLDKALKGFSFNDKYVINFFERFLTKELQLGNVIENDWMAFSNELLIFYKIKKLNSYQSQIVFLENELDKQYQLSLQYKNLVINDKEQRILINKKIEVDSILYSKNVTSKIDYNTNRQNFYIKKSDLEQNSLALNRVNLEITRLQNSIQNYKNNEKEGILTQQLSIRKSLNKLKSSIATWKRNFMLISPIIGKVSFVQDLEQNKFTEGNAIIIIPEGDTFYGSINIPILGAGKVKSGQKVIVKLNDYPYREFGVLTGTLTELYPVANEKSYIGRVKFEDINLSSYNKKVTIKENMNGIADVVTNDRNVLERLFQTILYAFNKK
jgi:HlyD family secretion protein